VKQLHRPAARVDDQRLWQLTGRVETQPDSAEVAAMDVSDVFCTAIRDGRAIPPTAFGPALCVPNA